MNYIIKCFSEQLSFKSFMHMIEQILIAIEINGYLISWLSISGIYFTSKSPTQMNQNPIAIAIRTTDNGSSKNLVLKWK